MSFNLNKPFDPTAPQTVRATLARRTAATPAFKPDFARSLRMHPRVAIVAAAMVLTLLLAYALLSRPAYQAESLVYVEPAAIKALAVDAGTFDATKYDSYIQQQILTAGRLDILVTALESLPPSTWQGYGPTLQAAANRLQNELKIQRAGSSYQLSFVLRGPNPVQTADILNAIVKTFLSAGRKDELAQAGVRTQLLLEERQRLQKELAAGKAEQAQLSAVLGMANPGLDAGNAYDEQLTGLRTQLAAARENHQLAAAQLAAVSGQEAAHLSGLTAAADEAINTDPSLSAMRSSVGQRRATLIGQMAGLTSENPIYKQDQTELTDLDRQLAGTTQTARDQAARRLQDKLRTEVARTGDMEARLNTQLTQQTGAASSAGPKLQRAAELNADLKRLMTRFASVDDSLRSLQLDAGGPGLAHLALAATPPSSPVASRTRLLMLAAPPLALLCGLFAAVFARKRDRHIYTGLDLEDVLGFTPIAVLPAAADVSSTVLDEYVLRLAAGVEGAYRAGNACTFVVTAAGAMTDIPAFTRLLQSRLATLGLYATTVSASQILDPRFVLAGNPHVATAAGSALDLRADVSARNDGFAAAHLDQLKTAHDLVLIQSPPILTSAETEYVVRLADATILVAESGVTTRGDLLQAALLLERLNVRGLGAVLDNLLLRNADPAYLKAIRLLQHRQTDPPFSPSDHQTKAAPATPAPLPSHDGRHDSPSVFKTQTEDASSASAPFSSVPVSQDKEVEYTVPASPQLDLSVSAPQPESEIIFLASENIGSMPILDSLAIQADTSTPGLPTASAAPAFDVPDNTVASPQAASDIHPPSTSCVPAAETFQPPFAPETLPKVAEWFQPWGSTQAVQDLEPSTQQAPDQFPLAALAELPPTLNPLPRVHTPTALTESVPDATPANVTAQEPFAAPIAARDIAPEPAPEASFLLDSSLPAETLTPAEPTRVSLPMPPEAKIDQVPLTPAVTLQPVVNIPVPVRVVPGPEPVEASQPTGRPATETPARPLDAETSGSFRTARMEAEPTRRNVDPWRDRRIAGTDTAIHPSDDRRFNWAARTANLASQLAARNAVAAPPAAPVQSVEPPPEPGSRPHLVPREVSLSRNWSLLSRYQNPSQKLPPDEPEEVPREYRRG